MQLGALGLTPEPDRVQQVVDALADMYIALGDTLALQYGGSHAVRKVLLFSLLLSRAFPPGCCLQGVGGTVRSAVFTLVRGHGGGGWGGKEGGRVDNPC